MSFGHKLKLGAIALSASLMVLHLAHRDSIRVSSPSPHPVEAAVSPIYFSPGTNPEDVDLSLVEHAHRSIDVAMYTFTDHRIAEAMRRAPEPKRGVLVRIYRDREQYEQELRRDSTVSTLLAGEPRIHVKVKNGRELMHEKAMLCDDSVLRSGSGNWSVSAARYQDNEVSVTTDPSSVAAFSRDFREMWERSDNRQVR
jgi:phosphatidylserine/phosphatidylglycerophosphate/cardiolipin synthase-like enzyme